MEEAGGESSEAVEHRADDALEEWERQLDLGQCRWGPAMLGELRQPRLEQVPRARRDREREAGDDQEYAE